MGLTLTTTAGWLPNSKSTSQTCPRKGSGAVIGRHDSEREGWRRIAVEVVHLARHSLLRRTAVQQGESSLDDIGATPESEDLCIGSELFGETAPNARLPDLRGRLAASAHRYNAFAVGLHRLPVLLTDWLSECVRVPPIQGQSTQQTCTYMSVVQPSLSRRGH
ncbi:MULTISPECIES: hypothetical protein [unclassified Modestobacter]